jgi:hypothetical protein
MPKLKLGPIAHDKRVKVTLELPAVPVSYPDLAFRLPMAATTQ